MPFASLLIRRNFSLLALFFLIPLIFTLTTCDNGSTDDSTLGTLENPYPRTFTGSINWSGPGGVLETLEAEGRYVALDLSDTTITDDFAPVSLDGRAFIVTVILPKGLDYIEDLPFGGCKNLISVTISGNNTIVNLGFNAFAACESLTSIVVYSSHTLYSSQNGVLCSKDKTGLVCWPPAKKPVIIPNSVTAILTYAFIYCGDLTSITIPSSIATIELLSLSYCTKLTEVTFYGGSTSIVAGSFPDGASLVSLYPSQGAGTYIRDILTATWSKKL